MPLDWRHRTARSPLTWFYRQTLASVAGWLVVGCAWVSVRRGVSHARCIDGPGEGSRGSRCKQRQGVLAGPPRAPGEASLLEASPARGDDCLGRLLIRPIHVRGN
jgi:hypothetical protein